MSGSSHCLKMFFQSCGLFLREAPSVRIMGCPDLGVGVLEQVGPVWNIVSVWEIAREKSMNSLVNSTFH